MDVADPTGWDLTPLSGGWSGRTWRAGGPGEWSVVRFFPPELPLSAPEVEAAVLSLVRGLVPVPEVLEVRLAAPAEDRPGLLVTSWVDGVTAGDAWDRWDRRQRARFGAEAGGCAAALAGMPFLRSGEFVDADLTVRPWPPHAAGLEQWVELHRPRLVDWSVEELASLDRVAARAQAHLDEVGRVSLVHSDLNPKNIVVEPETGTVRAVVDWEFAHAGHPATDLGNLLRLHRDPGYQEAVLGAYVDRHGGTAEELLHEARSADLWALVELAARHDSAGPARSAAQLLRCVAQQEDLHAWPGTR